MHRRPTTRAGIPRRATLALALATGALSAGIAQAASLPTTHVPQEVSSRAASAAGTPDAARELQIAIALPMRHLDRLEALVRDLYDPASPQYRHYLSVAEFTERYGPTEADYAKALSFFAEHGLVVTGTAANRYLIEGKASVATLERLLHVRFGLYRHPTENRLFIAPDREPTLDLDVAVLHVIGLDDASPPTNRFVQRADGATAASPVNGSAPGGWYLGSDIRAAYYGSGALTGAGQSVGLMELGPYNPDNIQTYFTTFGPPLTTQVVPISTDGSAATCTGRCPDGEQALDIEYAIAMAPGLAQMQVYVAKSAESVLNRMASDNTSAQLSTSWGWREQKETDEPIFLEMAAQGQTLLTASGDYSSLARSGPWPEESAYITGVGGTDLQTAGPGGAWTGETGWSGSAGGPSLDTSITIPKYQRPFINASNGGSTQLRNVPDIAGDADTVNYICAGGRCSGGNGGTSFASPIWAGFIALANEAGAAQGLPRIGFLNPMVYGLGIQANYPNVFHDTVGGKSGKFTAVAGYDLVTGLGSPQGHAFIGALLGRLTP
ncbi:MAG: S8/S53 family peptidase [Proteobacteria bacterium]|nr:S8/S53 family peptidase [Pseudomonadota bacterium]